MQNVTSLIQKSLGRQQNDSVRDDHPSDKVMERLWELMLEIFGHKWESNYGMEPTEGWRRSLKGITPEMIAKGFQALYEKGEEWPPSATEFAAMCKGRKEEITGSWGTGAHRIYRKDRLLEDVTAKESAHKAGEEALDALKGMFS